MKSHEEALAIFNKFGIQVEQVEPSVYKVINNTEDVNITDLEWELTECLMLTSSQTGSEKTPEGYWNEFAHVYYIITDYSKEEQLWKYEDISSEERETVVSSFKYNPNHVIDEIPTLYDQEEIEWLHQHNRQEK